MPYLLIPAALTGCAEWAGYLTQLILLLAAISATALAALRLGLNPGQARLAALLTACCPAVLGMAGTVMPDIPAMLFAALGIERIAAWRDHRRWHQSLLATCWLALAALTRAHAILLLAPAGVLLLDGIGTEEIRASFRNFPARFLPILLTPLVFIAATAITADPESQGEKIVVNMLRLPGGLRLVVENTCAFLAHLLLVIPLTVPWIVLRFRQLSAPLLLIVFIGASILSLRLGWVAFAAGATIVAFADILGDAIARRDRVQLALWLWLLLALPVVIYVHLPSKYVLPSVPAAVMLVVRLIPPARREPTRWLVPSVATAGIVLGVLVLLGIRDLAETQRRAVADLIYPQVRLGERVWFAGHWGFQWYAERAGASPVTREPPLPQPGDIIVISQIDLPVFPRNWSARRVIRRASYMSGGFGRVMDFQARAGFFSSLYGYLPWIWGSGDASRFEVWRVE